jgi:hypothetical protein
MTDQERMASLARTAEQAASIRLWMQQPAAKLVTDEMARLAGKDNLRWLTASDSEAAKMREDAKPYAKFFEVVKRLILEGDQARNVLDAQSKNAPPSQDGQGA